MIHLLFLVNRHYDYFKLLVQSARDHGVLLDIVTYDTVRISYTDGKPSVTFGDASRSHIDLVHFRHTSDQLEMNVALSEYFRHNGTIMIDPAFDYSSPWIYSKNFSYMRLGFLGLPIINSIFLSKKRFEQENFVYPVIVKISDGSQGEGVHLCSNRQEALAIFDQYNKDLLVQEYIPNDGDIRVLVVGGEVLGAMKRKSTKEQEFRNNYSLGGIVEPFNLDEAGRSIALQATLALRYAIAGVDLIKDKNGGWKILEVNQSPQFGGFMQATGINVPEKIIAYCIQLCEEKKV